MLASIPSVNSLKAAGGRLYYLSDGSSGNVLASGGEPNDKALSSPAALLTWGEDGEVYWVRDQGPQTVLERPGALKPALVHTWYYADKVRISSVLGTQKFLYYAGERDLVGTLERLPLEGGDPQPVFTGARWVSELVSDGAWIYWMAEEASTHRIWRVARAGGGPEPLAVIDGFPGKLAEYHGCLFISLGGEIVRMPRDGGPLARVAQSPGEIAAMAFYDGYLYWAAQDKGVMRVSLSEAP